MYNIAVPDTVNRFIKAYYLFGIWNKENVFFNNGLKIFHFTCSVLFLISMLMGAWIADDIDNSIFLTVASLAFSVHTFRLAYTILKKTEILTLIDQVGKQSTTDDKEFGQIKNKLKIIMQLVESFLWLSISSIVLTTVIPLISNEKKLVFNIWVPLALKKTRIAFWVAYVLTEIGSINGLLSFFITLIIWYLLVNFAIKYEMLGNQLRRLGVIRTTETSKKKSQVSVVDQQKLFIQQLIVAIESHQTIDKQLDQFAAYFGNLFLYQMSTSSIGICGSIYTLLYKEDGNVLQYGIYCTIITYYFLDIFIMMYLGHEIQKYRDRLSYCLYESNWIEQTQSSKTYVVILAEVLKQQKKMIIAKLYPLNLDTFTVIIKAAYSWFNVLKNLK